MFPASHRRHCVAQPSNWRSDWAGTRDLTQPPLSIIYAVVFVAAETAVLRPGAEPGPDPADCGPVGGGGVGEATCASNSSPSSCLAVTEAETETGTQTRAEVGTRAGTQTGTGGEETKGCKDCPGATISGPVMPASADAPIGLVPVASGGQAAVGEGAPSVLTHAPSPGRCIFIHFFRDGKRPLSRLATLTAQCRCIKHNHPPRRPV